MIDILEPDFGDLPGRRAVPRICRRSADTCSHIDVSIITPFYNTEEFFFETFVSLQAQLLQNWEWLIVDDGSTERDAVIRLAAVAAMDDRIKIIHQENAGPGAARNTAFRSASGRNICLLDSDDMVEPTYLEKCVWFLDSHPEYSFCNSYSIMFGDQEFLWTTGFERGKDHLQANSGPPISVIRRSAFTDCGGFDESIRFGHEDWDFWLAMAKTGHWGYTIPEFLQWYRKRGNGRYEQIMRSGDVNFRFNKYMHQKYKGLDKHFPQPRRRHLQPYETFETTSLVTNGLPANPSGRRIMFLVPWMVVGGADQVNLDLIEGLAGRGHDVTVCATLSADHQWESQFSHFTPDIFVLPKFLQVSDYPRFLIYLIQSRQIDTVLISGSTFGYQLLPYLRSISPNVCFVDLCHVEEPHWLNGGHPRFGVGYQDVLDLNMVTTKHLGKWMKGRGADGARIRTLYTGVRSVSAPRRAESRVRIRAELNIPLDMPVIVFAGRICEQKRPAMLAEILKNLRDRGVVFRALVIGDGELRLQFEGMLRQSKLTDDVQMLGTVPHLRWLDILMASDIFLMPSQYEGISVALLEAIAAGVVPIVAKVGGQVEIVSPDVGVLIPHGDDEVQAYLNSLDSLLSDSESLQHMSKRCMAVAASKLSWTRMIDSFEAFLDEAHQFRVDQPRNLISPSLGRELASQAIECKRLSDAMDWQSNMKNPWSASLVSLPDASRETRAFVKLAIVLSQTWLGRAIVRIQFLKAVGRWLLRRMVSSSAS